MNLSEIKAAVDSGKTVHWSNDGYTVIKDKGGKYLVLFVFTGDCIGLTWEDGKTLNGREENFFLASNPES